MDIFTLSFLIMTAKIYVVGLIVAVVVNSFVLGYKSETPNVSAFREVLWWPVYLIALLGIITSYYNNKKKGSK